MPNSPKDIINIDLNEVSKQEQLERPTDPVEQQPAPTVSSSKVQASNLPKEPQKEKKEEKKPGKFIRNLFTNKKPINETTVASEPPSQAIKPTIPDELPTHSLDEDEYLYNKSIIGGIDQSKLEYKETFKPKVSFNKPSHLYSWIVLAILLLIGLSSGVLYFLYPELFNFGSDEILVEDPLFEEEIVEPIITEEDIGLREKLLQVKAPFLLSNDIVLQQFEEQADSIRNPNISSFLSTQTLEAITAEFHQVKAIISESSNNNNQNSQTPEEVEAQQ